MADTTKGYDPNFLGKRLALPKIKANTCAPLLKGEGAEIQYTHYSVFQHKTRLLPLMTACNIKGEAYNADTREDSTEPWDYSDQIDRSYQLGGDFYANDDKTFDRGHIVRRVDPSWGDDAIAKAAEMETFRWVNCTPQHKKLNQKGGAWFQLEQHVMENGVKDRTADISVFAGPVLKADDLPFIKPYKNKDLPIPIVFWKVIVWRKSDGKLYAVGFLMSQWEFIKDKLKPLPVPEKKVVRKAAKAPMADDHFEQLKFKDNKTYQVPIADIEAATGIRFNWRNVTFPFAAAKPKAIKERPVQKVFSFKTIHEASAETAVTRKGIVSKSAVRKSLLTRKALTQKQVAAAVKNGTAAALKRYELKGIVL